MSFPPWRGRQQTLAFFRRPLCSYGFFRPRTLWRWATPDPFPEFCTPSAPPALAALNLCHTAPPCSPLSPAAAHFAPPSSCHTAPSPLCTSAPSAALPRSSLPFIRHKRGVFHATKHCQVLTPSKLHTQPAHAGSGGCHHKASCNTPVVRSVPLRLAAAAAAKGLRGDRHVHRQAQGHQQVRGVEGRDDLWAVARACKRTAGWANSGSKRSGWEARRAAIYQHRHDSKRGVRSCGRRQLAGLKHSGLP